MNDPVTPTPWKPKPYVDRRERITFEDALAELTLNDLVLDRRSDGSWHVRAPDGSTWLDAATPALAIEEWIPEWCVLMPGVPVVERDPAAELAEAVEGLLNALPSATTHPAIAAARAALARYRGES